MNLKDIVDELNRMLSSVPQRGERGQLYEFRVSVEMVDDIYWHLKQSLEKNGNQGRPPPHERSKERYQKGWEDIWGGTDWESPFAQKRRSDRATAEEMEERTRRAHEKMRQQEREQAQRNSDYFEELFRKSQQFNEEAFKKHFHGFEEAFQQRRRTPPPNPPAERNPWEVLGLRPGTPKPQIIKAYRSLAMKLHPDRPGGDTKKFQELQAAKEQLVGKS